MASLLKLLNPGLSHKVHWMAMTFSCFLKLVFLLQKLEVLHTILMKNVIMSAWIGAFYLFSDHNIVFRGNGQPVASAFWDVFEPNHANCNCGKKDGAGGKLAMEDCDTEYLGLFCETDPTVRSSTKQLKQY